MNHVVTFPRLSRLALLSAAVASGAIATTAVSFWLASPSYAAPTELQDSPKAILDEAWQIVNREYVDPNFNQVDWQRTRQELLSRDYTSRQQAYEALNKALEQLGDPYTRFMNPSQYQALTSQTAGEMSGVGLRLEVDETRQVLQVAEPIENSPAIRAGLQAGDRILAIDGQSTRGMTAEAAAKLIRGEVGTQVTLLIERESGQSFPVALTRARIELPTVRYTLREEAGQRIGYIRLSEFNAHAADQMRRAIRNLESQNVQAFVLDLRGNPGGLLHASIEIARMWMKEGAIVQTVDRENHDERIMANRTALTELPLAILVDGNSASASEILTGALKDNQRATVIGTQTFGKALVQSVHGLSDGSGIAVTIAHYYTPNGTDISKKGITPDIAITLTEDQRRQLSSEPQLLGTPRDPQYSQAVRLLSARGVTVPVAIK